MSQPVSLGSLRAACVLLYVPLSLLLLLLLRPGCAGNEAARPFCGAEAKLPPAARRPYAGPGRLVDRATGREQRQGDAVGVHRNQCDVAKPVSR